MSFTHDEVRDWMERFAAEVAENRSYLTKLDGAIGVGDHGTKIDRGLKKARERLGPTDGLDIGAAGPLYGTFFMQMGQAASGRSELDVAGFTEAFDAGLQGVIKRGKAEPGDKTMVDALTPALEALRAADGDDVAAALGKAAQAAQQGMEATVPMVARKGRASYLGERSAGHQDPGATSSHLLLKSAAEAAGATD